MTGKELVLALVGAGLVGGGAGVAANLAVGQKTDTAAAAPTAEVVDRLKAIEAQLAQAKASAEESRRTMLEVQDRVTKAELAASRQAAAPETAAGPAGTKTVRIGRHAARAGDSGAQAGVVLDDAAVADLGGQIALNLGDELGKLDGDMGEFAGQIDSLRNGLKLRALPEADRWQKAKDDLGLTWNQVEDLKKAVADRDAAMKDAMTKETKAGPNGGTITIQRPDAGKAAHAEAAYHDRVNATLSEQQKKDWGAKGYDHAFGSAPFGGGNMVMTIGLTDESKQSDAPKDAAK
jgi:hypothetical protein